MNALVATPASTVQSLEPTHNCGFSSAPDKWQSSEITTCPLTARGSVSIFQWRKTEMAQICFITRGIRVVRSGHVQYTRLCELAFLLFKTLFQHLILYGLMSINLCPGIHCRSCVRDVIEKELGRKYNEIRINPVIAPSDCIWLLCEVSQSVTSMVLSWTASRHCW